MHPASLRYISGQRNDDVAIAAFDQASDRSTGRSRENELRQTLAERVARWTEGVDHLDTAIPNLSFHRREAPTQPMECMVEPSFGLVVQGAKRVMQSGDAYIYDTDRFLITSLDLPGSTQIIEASPDKPFLGLGLKLDFRVMAELMMQVAPDHDDAPAGRGLVVGDMTEPLYDALNRLLALLDDPNAIAVLAPYVEREIYYRLLTSDQGARLRQIASAGSQCNRVSRAIRWLRAHYDESLRVDDLAAQVQMSSSTFHHHFRQLTGMSPLQYQKWIRLNEARRLMLAERLDAASAAFRVGYASPTQFNREYSRLFGNSPRRDIDSLRGGGDVALSIVASY
ncbi:MULTISPECIES: AraC family transcriptional regulator [Burkholderia cepacia complex]|uniref:AraC family transcriptional regulator n=1 Tax=Burkholderia cenocepacia TaxID=95486 RepID=A0AAW4TRR8_9BURK|nr:MULTISPECIES: AraC family transcriptional regulator [Burkholderia cepacia complex]AQQ31731.1 AraC family transcriptional regulator [Burkholderia cenocepacia]MBK1823480.1 AraC family transcriptional regulator [Burkholderia orbicola]MBR7957047.1 AraC family transcriptional regulator [Burkholderia cenocepacia]MBR7990137.1 AraC family transcriptional regulator [Burkholderia cenocepacia]MBR8041267.1 AraC family transcriptional regulator [Burkholderia cenocepacia]